MKGLNHCLLYFYEACIRYKSVRPKPRKCKGLVELRDKVEVIHSYFACLNLKFRPKLFSNISEKIRIIGEEEDNYSRGSVVCCESMTYTDIIQCNSRFHEESNVGIFLKDSLLRMGLV